VVAALLDQKNPPLLNFNQIDKNLRKSFSFLAVSGVIGKE